MEPSSSHHLVKRADSFYMSEGAMIAVIVAGALLFGLISWCAVTRTRIARREANRIRMEHEADLEAARMTRLKEQERRAFESRSNNVSTTGTTGSTSAGTAARLEQQNRHQRQHSRSQSQHHRPPQHGQPDHVMVELDNLQATNNNNSTQNLTTSLSAGAAPPGYSDLDEGFEDGRPAPGANRTP